MSENQVIPEQQEAEIIKPDEQQSESQEAEKADSPEAEKKEQETPEKRESRNARRFNREREARIAAETELRLMKEAQGRQESAPKLQTVTSDEPKREDFATYEDFMRADARYQARVVAREESARTLKESREREANDRTKSERDAVLADWNKRVEAARDDIEDFDEVCSKSDATVTPAMSAAILESEHGARITFYLAKHPDEAEAISEMKPSKQAAAIVALEAKVAKPAKTPSKAAAPISPVNGRSGPTSEMPSDSDDIATWMAKEKARVAKMASN